MMEATYDAGAPWMGHGTCVADMVAAMTGHRGHRGGRGGGHDHRHGFGPPWAMFGGQMPWGPPPWVGGPKGPWRPPKARRGDVRAAILGVLADETMNGYQIIQEVAERSGGVWKPSPGSIYPTLQQLEDEGLVRADERGGRRTYGLTDEGRHYVETHAEEIAAPWEAMAADQDAAGGGDDDGLRPLIGQVAAAVWQVVATGTPDQQARARDVLAEMRRRLYGILAEGDPDDADNTRGGGD
ncbi:MAG TPA: PadR family transcriptional regulator [Jiangellaceae bacterium]|nr:PadR family transcriptional regulator [Jiangellaceae bacterium]